jgi:hypothetical protein
LKKKTSITLLLVSLLLLGCQAKNVVAPVVDPKAAAEWSHNEKIFEKALNGDQGGGEFDRACEFFWRLTGIELHVNYSTVGMLPTTETPKDLMHIRDWYQVNKSRLYWDEAAGAVKVRPVGK